MKRLFWQYVVSTVLVSLFVLFENPVWGVMWLLSVGCFSMININRRGSEGGLGGSAASAAMLSAVVPIGSVLTVGGAAVLGAWLLGAYG